MRRFVSLTFGLVLIGLLQSSLAPCTKAQQPIQQSPPPKPRPEVQILLDKALKARQQYQWSEALRVYEEARKQAEVLGDVVGEAIALNNSGAVYSRTGAPQKALRYYEQALPLLRAAGDKGGEAATFNNIGTVYSDTGAPQKALRYFEQALPLLRATGDKAGEARTLTNIGTVYSDTGAPQKALRYYEQALPLLRAAGDKAGEAATFNNIATVYSDTGAPQKALRYFEQALPLLRAVGDKQGEARMLTNIGYIYSRSGESQKALQYYEQALPLRRAVGDKAGEAWTLTNIGVVYSDTGEQQKALQYYEQALPLRRAVGDKAGEARTLTNIGMVYSDTGAPQKALQYYEQALPLLRAADDKAGEATTLNNVGYIYSRTSAPQKALQYYEQALPLLRAVGDKQGEATTLNNVGYIYSRTRAPQKALQYYEQALLLWRAVGDKAGEAATFSNIGAAYSDTGEPQKALRYCYQSLVIEEAFYARISDPTQVSTLQQHRSTNLLVTYTANVLNQLHRPGDALAMLERGRTYGLARLAAQNRLRLTTLLGHDASAWQNANHRFNTLDRQMKDIGERLSSARAIRNTEAEKFLSSQLSALRDQGREAEVSRDRLFAHLLQDHPDFQHLFFGQKMTYPALKKALLASSVADAHTLFLEFGIVDDKHTLLFALSRNEGLRSFVLPIGDRTLSDRVEKWRDSILHALPDETEQAKQLYRALLQPPKQQGRLNLQAYHSLVIVADGPLLDVPFTALIDPKGSRLVQRFAISSPFSLTMFTWPASERAATKNLLAIANPLGPKPELPHTEDQAREMTPLFLPADLMTGSQPTKTEVLHRLGDYRLLHFGVHGEANSQNGLYSRLLLAGVTESEQELTAAEITEHPLAAQLAVLSACETMQGQKSGGEGLLGLAWAFRAAGCPSVMASQWKVDEAATASLMTRFYRGLRGGARKDIALQKAMLGVMQEPGHEAPYYWAAFQVMGKTDPLRLVSASRGGSSLPAKRAGPMAVRAELGHNP